MKENNSKDKVKKIEMRIKIAQSLMLLFFCILVGYLFLLQIVDIRHYRAKALGQRFSKSFVMRGQIVDRNGVRLATDKTSYNVSVHREYFDHTPEELAQKLAPFLKMEEKDIVNTINKGSIVILLKKDVDRNTVEEIKKLGLREVCLDKKNERVYPQDELAAHIIGYYNPDADTASGVELTAKEKLEKVNNKVENMMVIKIPDNAQTTHVGLIGKDVCSFGFLHRTHISSLSSIGLPQRSQSFIKTPLYKTILECLM